MANETSETCQVVAGVLVPRPCGQPAKGQCARCQTRVCTEHGRVTEAGLVCRYCAEGQQPPPMVLDVPADLAFRPEDVAAFEVERPDMPASAWSDLT
jgi:hypothetical protein